MKITRQSIVSAKTHTIDLSITPKQWACFIQGADINVMCPELSQDEKIFLVYGITPEEWDNLCNEKEHENG